MTRVLLPVAHPAQTRAALRAMMAARPGLAAAAGAALIGATVAGLAVPPILGAITDAVLEERGTGRIDLLAGALLTAVALQAALTAVARVATARLGEQALAGLREEVVDRAVHLSPAQVEQAGTGDLLARVGDDVDAVSEAIRDAVPEIVTATLTVLLTIVGLGLLDWRLALAGFAAVPVHVLATRWYLRRSGPLYAAERVANSARAQQLNETVAGVATLRAFGLAARHHAHVSQASRLALDHSLRAARTGSRFFAHLNGAELLGLAATLAVGYAAVDSGAATVGEATAAALYFHGLFGPIGSLLGLLDTAQDAGASLNRLVGVVRMPWPPEPGSAPYAAETGATSVELRDVVFAYTEGHLVLHEVSLSVGAGEQVAIVGTSGAGKSTIAKLVAGIHPPRTGVVLVGGAPQPVPGRGGTVLLVTQEVHVFAGPLAEDLRLARPDAGEPELRKALQAVGALGWVDALPAGLATVVGDGGHRLTAAQAQQLALARVALRDDPVVVLDEATAEAGSAGARILERSARAATQGRTCLIVAHRLTQAAASDRIVVLDRGRVAETGTHEQLLAVGGRYAALWAAWSTHRPPGTP